MAGMHAFYRPMGYKTYEMKDWLGSPRLTFSDVKGPVDPAEPDTNEYEYKLLYLSGTTTYPYGARIDSLSFDNPSYRFGFTGHLKDNLIRPYYGDGANYSTLFREYDPIIGRWWSIDPLRAKYAGMSPYNYAAGNPISLFDKDGLEPIQQDIESAPKYESTENYDAGLYPGLIDFYSTPERLEGAGRAVVGLGQMTAGAGLFLTPEPTPITKLAGIGTFINGADEFGTGFMQFLQGTSQNSLKYQAIQSGSNALGIDRKTSQDVAAYGETGINLLSNATAIAYDAYSIYSSIQKTQYQSVFVLVDNCNVEFSEELVKEAQLKYPKKAGKIERHHPIPQYLGGAKKQELVPLNAAYHQVITNAFRKEYGYGLPKPNETELQKILRTVYNQYPLPSK